jgi:hypothetical protein
MIYAGDFSAGHIRNGGGPMEIHYGGMLGKEDFLRAQAISAPMFSALAKFAIGLVVIAVLVPSAVVLVFFLGLIAATIGFRLQVNRWHSMWERVSPEYVRGVASDAGIGSDDGFLAWSSMRRVKVARNLVLLYPPAGSVIIFPRSFFRDDKDWQAFVALGKTALKRRKSQVS